MRACCDLGGACASRIVERTLDLGALLDVRRLRRSVLERLGRLARIVERRPDAHLVLRRLVNIERLVRLAVAAMKEQVLLRALDDGDDVVAVELGECRLEVELVLGRLVVLDGLGTVALGLGLVRVRVNELRVGPVVVVRRALGDLAVLLLLTRFSFGPAALLGAARPGLALALLRLVELLVVALQRARLVVPLVFLVALERLSLCRLLIALAFFLALAVVVDRLVLRPERDVLRERVEPAREARLGGEVGV